MHNTCIPLIILFFYHFLKYMIYYNKNIITSIIVMRYIKAIDKRKKGIFR